MPQSFRCKLKKLSHDGNISNDELDELLSKLDGHDAKVRAEAIDEVAHALLDCNDKLTRSIVRRILEQMKGESNEDKNL